MIHSKAFFKKFKGFGVGPGGMKCGCCRPPKQEWPMYFRIGRKRLNREALRLELQDLYLTDPAEHE